MKNVTDEEWALAKAPKVAHTNRLDSAADKTANCDTASQPNSPITVAAANICSDRGAARLRIARADATAAPNTKRYATNPDEAVA